jgi:hypothetical protein
MEPQPWDWRRPLGVGARVVVLVAAVIFLQGNGCTDFLKPTKTGVEQCRASGLLYCNSATVPQTLSGGVPGTCCAVGDAPNAGVGYLCAFGADKAPAGCVSTLELARGLCPSAPSIVRCTN